MSEEQRDALDAMLRDAPLDLGGDVQQQREIFEQMMQQTPAPEDIAATAGTPGGVPVVHIDVPGADPARVIFYIHGGAYAVGSADSSVALASDLARRAGAPAAAATMLALRDAQTPLPSAAFLMSPWIDLTVSGESITTVGGGQALGRARTSARRRGHPEVLDTQLGHEVLPERGSAIGQ